MTSVDLALLLQHAAYAFDSRAQELEQSGISGLATVHWERAEQSRKLSEALTFGRMKIIEARAKETK